MIFKVTFDVIIDDPYLMLKKVSATMAVIYPPERKLAKRISVQCLIKKEAIICAIFLLEFLACTLNPRILNIFL